MCPYLPDIQQSSIESFLRAIYLAEKSENSSKTPFISIDPRPETVSQRQMFFLFFPLPRQKSIQSQSSCLLSATSGYSSFLTLCHFLLFSLLELLEQKSTLLFVVAITGKPENIGDSWKESVIGISRDFL